MPPEEKFSREAVASAAFELVRKRGMAKLTARNIAKRLKSSTAPVYQHFRSMEVMKQEVMRRAKEHLLQYMAQPYSEMRFLNMGVGYIAFAREEAELFRALFLERGVFREHTDETLVVFGTEMAQDGLLAPLDEEQRTSLLHKMWTFAHGLATMVWAGIIEDSSDEHIIEILKEMGGLAIEAEIRKQQN